VSVEKIAIEDIDVSKTKPSKVISLLLEIIYKIQALELCSVEGKNFGVLSWEKRNRVKLAPAGLDAIVGEWMHIIINVKLDAYFKALRLGNTQLFKNKL